MKYSGNLKRVIPYPLQWRHNERNGVSNHQPHDCLLNRLFRRRSMKTSKLRVTGLCAWNSPVTGEFPAQRASYAENVSIWWRHHVFCGLIFWTFSINSIWRHKSRSASAQVMAGCLVVPSHYLNQFWLIIKGVLFCGIHIRANLREMFMSITRNACLEITHLKLVSHRSGSIELSFLFFICSTQSCCI